MARSMTQGSPARLILSFAVPLLIGNLFQQLYTMIDTLIVGRTIGVSSLAAVGSTGGIMFFLIGFVQAMTNGFSIITAQYFGAKKAALVRKSFCVSITLSAIAAVVLASLGLFFVKDVLLLLQTPEEILEEAHSYAIVICGGIGSAVLYNLLSNTIMALGDSRPSLIFLIIACVLNIILDLLFILVFSWGVAGAAWATVTAQCSSCLLCILYIAKKIPTLRLRRKDWKFTAKELAASAKLGLPMGFQASIIAIGAIILQWALNTLGPVSVAAFTVVRSIDMIAILPLASFGLSMGTYVGQNYGAGNIARIRQGVRQCCIMSLSFAAFIALVNIVGGRMLVAIFVGAGQEGVTVLAQKFLIINGCMYWVLALLFIFRFSLQGLGKSFAPTVAGIMELLMRALAAVVLTRLYGFVGACLASPLAWLGACIPLAIAYYLNIRELSKTPPPPGGSTDGNTDDGTNGSTDDSTDGNTNGSTDDCTNGSTNGCANISKKGKKDEDDSSLRGSAQARA